MGSSTTFNKLTINNSAGVTLLSNETVNGTLTISSGTLSTGGNTVTLGSSATLSETSGNTVVGTVTTTRDVSQSSNNTFGGIGVEINAAGGAPGSTVVTRVTGTAQSGGGYQSIKRSFSITPTNNSGLNATFVFHYDESELNGNVEASLSLYKGSGSSWVYMGGTPTPASNLITLNNVADFSTWTAADASHPLPIQMASFAANVVRDNQVEVAWRTVSETNNYGFEIYRKRGDAGEWAKVSFLQGHGTTLAPQSYTYVDAGLSFGKYTYRIKQVDLDGKSETFPEMSVTVGVGPDKFVLAQNYPNPFNPSTLIEFVVPMSGHATMKVYNVLGQEVATLFDGNAEAGKINTARFNASNLPSGMYFYTLRSAGKVETKRMLLMK